MSNPNDQETNTVKGLRDGLRSRMTTTMTVITNFSAILDLLDMLGVNVAMTRSANASWLIVLTVPVNGNTPRLFAHTGYKASTVLYQAVRDYLEATDHVAP